MLPVLMNPELCKQKQQVTKESEHDIKMISQEAQFGLCFIVTYSEAPRCKFLKHRLTTYACTIPYN